MRDIAREIDEARREARAVVDKKKKVAQTLATKNAPKRPATGDALKAPKAAKKR
jgi:hypothetical protein